MINDPEISAMSNVYEAMKGLDSLQMKRLFNWLISKFDLDEEKTMAMIATVPVVRETAKVEVKAEPPAEPKVETKPEPKAEPKIEEIVGKKTRKKRVVKTPLKPEPVAKKVDETEEPQSLAEGKSSGDDEEDKVELSEVDLRLQALREGKEYIDEKSLSTKGFGLKRYKTIENLFLSSNTKTVSSRILLAAAFLQEKLNFTEIGSYDVNSRLKKMGYGVANITTALASLFKKNPPWLQYVQKEGDDSKQSKRRFIVTEEGLKVAKSYLKGISE